MSTEIRDTLGRPVRDLRVSLTDRCNFRCPYCMPKEVFGPDYAFLPNSQLLVFTELERLLRAFVTVGVEKIRFTGGEPLLRPDVVELIAMVKKQLRVPDVALTTNGWLLASMAGDLRKAGLDRVNVSLDTLDPARFSQLSGRPFSPERVLDGIRAAQEACLPVKINTVIQRGVNDDEVDRLAEWARGTGVTLRYIEYMDVGNCNGWARQRVVSVQEILATLRKRWPMEPVGPAYRGEVAARYRYCDGRGEIGLIGAITEPFCRDCNRARLSADGKLFTCLFATTGHDLRRWVRGGASDQELFGNLAAIWQGRVDRYSELRDELSASPKSASRVEMSFVGG